MQLSVTFRHMEPSESLKEYAGEKLTRLERYLDTVVEAHVVLSIEKFRHIADVTVMSDGLKIKGQEQTEEMYSSIDMVFDKLEKQAKRFREKTRDRKKHPKNKSLPDQDGDISSEVEDDDSDTEPQIVRISQAFAKPMDVNEAVMQLELSGDQFVVYTDSETEKINVLYIRTDGNFGLIEPLEE